VLAHGKEYFAVQRKQKRTATSNARQRRPTAHDKDQAHGKASAKRTAMKKRTAKRTRRCRERSFAVRKALPHGKGCFAVRNAQSHGKGCFDVHIFLCRVPCGTFSFFFLYCTYFNAYIYS
jgi:hypothetical protein